MPELWVYPLGIALGGAKRDVAELLEEFGPVREGFAERTGFSSLYASEDGESSLTLAVAAARAEPDSWWEESVDGLVSVTSTAELVAPGNGHLIQQELGLAAGLFILDINDACTGFVRALVTANSLIASGVAKTILIVLADTYTKLFEASDLKVSPLFSDGASAILVSKSALENVPDGIAGRRWEILSSSFLSEGGHADELCISRGASSGDPGRLSMNGGAVFNFVLRSIGPTLGALRGEDELVVDEWFVHQGSRAVVNAVEKSLSAAPGELFRAGDYGNVVGSSIPFQIYRDQGPVESVSTIGLLGFGVGLTIAGVIVRQSPIGD